MNKVLSSLGPVSIEGFLKNYWQKKPLLIRQAFTNFKSLISPEELAGLAMEDFVESRIIQTDGWALSHGPFTENEFNALPEKDWTLLVQGLDQLIPAFSELLESFRFIPSWRLDDIMVSYATDGGSVGPHFDNYDVFLLQAEGKRRWQLGGLCENDVKLLADTDLSILQDFSDEQEWVLEPGDMLYIPPKLAHWGIAQGNCLTYSIGFRAPSAEEIINHYCDFSLQEQNVSQRYKDGDLNANKNPYHISDDAIQQVRSLLLNALDNPQRLAQWFGSFMTAPRYTELADSTSTSQSLTSEMKMSRSNGARLAYITEKGKNTLFANGERWDASDSFVSFVCQHKQFTYKQLEQVLTLEGDRLVLKGLLESGVLQVDTRD